MHNDKVFKDGPAEGIATLQQIVSDMVSDDAFAELCQSIGAEPKWLKRARQLANGRYDELPPDNGSYVPKTIPQTEVGLPMDSVQQETSDVAAKPAEPASPVVRTENMFERECVICGFKWYEHNYGKNCPACSTKASHPTPVVVSVEIERLKIENDRLQTQNSAYRRRLEDIANQYAVDCL
jgi:hypothetical protein